ncbi:MAG: hypothetical protein M1827_001192 [Pycnora praestabilis]|nr:MAG: hypothetical protein M1827_001192 [Pycnora praestabilis]
MTVLFHMQGNTGVRNESLMMYIGVYAYGESRFELTFNPCDANIQRYDISFAWKQSSESLIKHGADIASLCPMNASIPIEANGIIPVAQSDVATIPPIALTIPDFEGYAILRIFANSTESEIGCYSAVITNGASFSHPNAVGTILGLFTVIALGASFVTAIYGDHVPTVRKHYAHSLSILVVFAVFHHIFFTSALSMNWPSVLAAFWSNYAWTGGMIYSELMQNSINQLIGSNRGNTSIVGAASSGSTSNNIGGGYSIQQIYKRASINIHSRQAMPNARDMLRSYRPRIELAKRALANSTDGYPWYGVPVKPGLPLPGNYSGFAGTLSEENIPASNAFMTGLLWFLILIVLIVAVVVSLKWVVEGLVNLKVVRKDRLTYFRERWIRYTASAALRTLLIGFFMMIFLTTFQFSYKGSADVTAIATIVFVIFSVGMFAVAGYACFYRLRWGRYASEPDRLHLERKKAWLRIPWYEIERESQKNEKTAQKVFVGSLPWWRIYYVDADPQRISVHEDEGFTVRFGWLAARFRRTRWWFFAVWLSYEFVRACFYGGAAGHPMTQVFGLLVIEIIAFIGMIAMKPFEGARLNALMVYLLGFSKVATLALSAAFDSTFNLSRIITVVIGVVIIVIQGVLTIILLIAVAIGTISSYFSLTRNREDFKPKSWAPTRQKYFDHIETTATDLPPPPPAQPQAPQEPYFSVSTVRRCPKIEDEDEDVIAEKGDDLTASRFSLTRKSRANSMHSQMSSSVPFGARVHRASWSSKDLNSWHENNQKDLDKRRPRTATPTLRQPFVQAGPSRSRDDMRDSTASGSLLPIENSIKE